MQKKNFPTAEILFLILGEVIVSLIVSGVYLILNRFSVSVIAGGLLGSAVAILNFVILSVSVNRAIDKAMEERGTGEMTDEEAAAFAQKNAAAVQRAAQGSYIIRQILMLGVLVGAFLLGLGSKGLFLLGCGRLFLRLFRLFRAAEIQGELVVDADVGPLPLFFLHLTTQLLLVLTCHLAVPFVFG